MEASLTLCSPGDVDDADINHAIDVNDAASSDDVNNADVNHAVNVNNVTRPSNVGHITGSDATTAGDSASLSDDLIACFTGATASMVRRKSIG